MKKKNIAIKNTAQKSGNNTQSVTGHIPSVADMEEGAELTAFMLSLMHEQFRYTCNSKKCTIITEYHIIGS